MQFNQVNQNAGDVNNNVVENHTTTNTASSQSGHVAQGVGTGNNVKAVPPKSGFWGEMVKRIKALFGYGG